MRFFSRRALAVAACANVTYALPAAQNSGYTNADAPTPSENDAASGAAPTVFGPDSQVPYIATSGLPPYPRVSSDVSGPTSHGPYDGPAPTVTGAVKAPTTLADAISPLPPNPTATYYNKDGILLNPAPAPYTPNGGLGTNGTQPRYMVNSDFDFESIALGLYQEWIELDLFHNGLSVFSEEDFLAAGLTAEDRSLIEFMAAQETGHATLLTNMLGEAAPVQCTYDYPFTTVREFIDFNQKLTRWGESGVWGFINHLDSREVAQLLSQSIATEARQQMSFRQMLGLHPYPVWFEAGIPQSWSWSFLAPYISSCPEGNTRLGWQNFPALRFANQPNPNRFSPNDTKPFELVAGNNSRASDPSDSNIPPEESCVNVTEVGYSCAPGISRNRSEPLSFPGKLVNLTWEAPGQAVGPNNSYVTSVSPLIVDQQPQFVAWVSQLNLSYTPLTITGENEGFTYQPAEEVYEGDPAVNGTMFVALTTTNEYFSAFNLSLINPNVKALGLYQAG